MMLSFWGLSQSRSSQAQSVFAARSVEVTEREGAASGRSTGKAAPETPKILAPLFVSR
jgi:hypothetical protein